MYLVYLLKLGGRFFKIETPLVDPFTKTLSLSLIFSFCSHRSIKKTTPQGVESECAHLHH